MHHPQSPLRDGHYRQALDAMGAVSQDLPAIHESGRGARYCENQQPIRRVARGMRETRSASLLDAGSGMRRIVGSGRGGGGGDVEGDKDVATRNETRAMSMSRSASCLLDGGHGGDGEDVDWLGGRGCDGAEANRHSRSLRSGITAVEDDSNQWLSEESWRHEDFFGSSGSASLLQPGKRRGTVGRGLVGGDESIDCVGVDVDRVPAAYCSQGDVLGGTSTKPESSVDGCSRSRTVKSSGASEDVSRDWLKDDTQHGGAVSVGESLSMEADHDVGTDVDADAAIDVGANDDVNTGADAEIGADAGTEADAVGAAKADADADVEADAGAETGADVEADSDAAPAGFAPTAAQLETPDAAVDPPAGTAASLETPSAEPSFRQGKARRGSGPDPDPDDTPSRDDEMASDGRGDPLRKPPNEAVNPEPTPPRPPRDYEVRGWMALDVANGGFRDVDGKRAVVSFRSSKSSDGQVGKRGSVPVPTPSLSATAKKKKERGHESEQEERVLRSGRRQRREFQQQRKQKQKQQSPQLENDNVVEPSGREGDGAEDVVSSPIGEENGPFLGEGDFGLTVEGVGRRSASDDDGNSSDDRTPRQEAGMGIDEESEEGALSELELKTGSGLESESIGGFHVDEEEGLVDPADDDTEQSAWEEGDSSSLEDGSASSATTVATAHVFGGMEEIGAEFTSSENLSAPPVEDEVAAAAAAAAEEMTAVAPETKTPERQPLSDKNLGQEPADLSELVAADVDEEDGATTGAAESPSRVGGGPGSGSSVEDDCAAEAEAESRGGYEQPLEAENEGNERCECAADGDQGKSNGESCGRDVGDVGPGTPNTDCLPREMKESRVNADMAKSVQESEESVEDDSPPTLSGRGDSVVGVAVGADAVKLTATMEKGDISTRSSEDVGALSGVKDGAGEGEEEAFTIPVSHRGEVRAAGSSQSKAQDEVFPVEDMKACKHQPRQESKVVSRRSAAEKDSDGGVVVTSPADDRGSVLEDPKGLSDPDDADTPGDVTVENATSTIAVDAVATTDSNNDATSDECVVEVGETGDGDNRRVSERSRASGDVKLVPEAGCEALPVGKGEAPGNPTVEAATMVVVAEEGAPPAGDCDTEDACDGPSSLSKGESSYSGVSCDNEGSEIDGVDRGGEDKLDKVADNADSAKNDPSPPDKSEDSARDKEHGTASDTVKDTRSAAVRCADSTSSGEVPGGTGATVDAPSPTIATACRASPALKDAKSEIDNGSRDGGETLTRGAARRLAVVGKVKKNKPATAAGEREGEGAIPAVSAAAPSGEEVLPPEEDETADYTVLLSDGCTRWDPFAGEETHRVAVWDPRKRLMIRGPSAPMRRNLRAVLSKGQYEVSSWRLLCTLPK